MAHKYGAKVVVDGAQIVAHRKFSMMGDLDDPDDDIDFIAFSAHKMYSPYGGGAVVGLTEELNEHMPEFYGGGTITLVGDDWQLYKKAPAAYEAGSPNYPGVVGLGKAIDVLSTIGMDNIEAHEKVLNKKIIDGLKKLDNIILYGDSENIDDRVGVISFNFSDINTYLLSESLSQLGGIATRRGAFCAHPYVWRLMKIDEETVKSFENCSDVNTAGMVRVSFGIYNNEADVDYFLDTMPKAMQDAKDRNIDEMAEPMY
jgi:selenocysteine lyase/cysteine desulfurase